MQKQPKPESRKLVPRWRELKRTPARELASSENYRDFGEINDQFNIALSQWDECPELESALKLSEFGMLGAESAGVTAAFQYVMSHPQVRDDLKTRFSQLSSDIPLISQGSAEEVSALISKIRHKLTLFPRHAILHCEIARLYSTLGQNKPAKRHLEMALRLAPENRYVIRSYVRFFVRSGKLDQAMAAFSKVKGTRDPWLLSAQVATADMAQSTKAIALKSIRDVLSDDLSPDQLSELAGSFGTLELNAGARRRAKRLFEQSAIDPNDNAVAQIVWANAREDLKIPVQLSDVPLSYEASALQFDADEDWRAALDHLRFWSKDEPFSLRPFAQGSYIAAEYLSDFVAAKEFAEQGLISNPKNPTLLNNLAFCLSELGEPERAMTTIVEAEKYDQDEDSRVAILATRGHILINLGNNVDGIELYKKAIEKAKSRREKSHAELAYLHLIKETTKFGMSIESVVAENLRKYFSEEGRSSIESKRVYKSIVNNIGKISFHGESKEVLQVDHPDNFSKIV